MDRLVTRIGNEPAVPTELDMDFAFDLDKRTFDGLQRIFNQLCDLTDILGDDYDLDRLKELVQADREERCVVLPCKVGETVYTIEQEFNGFCTEVKIEKRIIDGCGGNLLNPVWVVSKKPYELHYFPSEFGKTVFTTREEAESALEKMKDGDK